MIVFLHGILAEKTPARAVVECGGVGYEALIPLSTYERLPATGGEAKLLTYHEVREDAQLLYGFASEAERDLFALLVSISGVGPKIALSVISGLSVGEVQLCIANGDAKRLATVKGVGKKTAERIVVELRDKVNPIEALANGTADAGKGDKQVLRDAMLALSALGFADDAAKKMVQSVLSSHPEATDTESIVKLALKS